MIAGFLHIPADRLESVRDTLSAINALSGSAFWSERGGFYATTPAGKISIERIPHQWVCWVEGSATKHYGETPETALVAKIENERRQA